MSVKLPPKKIHFLLVETLKMIKMFEKTHQTFNETCCNKTCTITKKYMLQNTIKNLWGDSVAYIDFHKGGGAYLLKILVRGGVCAWCDLNEVWS